MPNIYFNIIFGKAEQCVRFNITFCSSTSSQKVSLFLVSIFIFVCPEEWRYVHKLLCSVWSLYSGFPTSKAQNWKNIFYIREGFHFGGGGGSTKILKKYFPSKGREGGCCCYWPAVLSLTYWASPLSSCRPPPPLRPPSALPLPSPDEPDQQQMNYYLSCVILAGEREGKVEADLWVAGATGDYQSQGPGTDHVLQSSPTFRSLSTLHGDARIIRGATSEAAMGGGCRAKRGSVPIYLSHHQHTASELLLYPQVNSREEIWQCFWKY